MRLIHVDNWNWWYWSIIDISLRKWKFVSFLNIISICLNRSTYHLSHSICSDLRLRYIDRCIQFILVIIGLLRFRLILQLLNHHIFFLKNAQLEWRLKQRKTERQTYKLLQISLCILQSCVELLKNRLLCFDICLILLLHLVQIQRSFVNIFTIYFQFSRQSFTCTNCKIWNGKKANETKIGLKFNASNYRLDSVFRF